MTLIVGMNLNGYAILGADTRVSSYANEKLVFRDDAEKIKSIECGLIAGAGLVDLIDAVNARIDDEEVGHTDRIIDLMKGEVAYARQQPWSSHPRVRDSINHTGWMFSYVTMQNANDPRTTSMRLAVLAASEGQLRLVQPSDVWLLTPTGTTEEQFWEWKRFAKNALQPLAGPTDTETFAKNLSYHVECIGTLMQTVSSVNDEVAQTYQVGVHLMAPALRGITNIISHDSNIEWDWNNGATSG